MGRSSRTLGPASEIERIFGLGPFHWTTEERSCTGSLSVGSGCTWRVRRGGDGGVRGEGGDELRGEGRRGDGGVRKGGRRWRLRGEGRRGDGGVRRD